MLSALLIGLFTVLVFLFISARRKRQGLPPGPTPLPIIGNLHQIDKIRPYDTFTQLGEKYGSVYTIFMGRKPAVILYGYDTLKESLLGQAEDFSGRDVSPVFERVARNKGMVFSNGPEWVHQRRFALTTLRNFGWGRKSIEERVVEEAKFLMELFKARNGKPFNPGPELTAAVSNAICSVVFGDRFDTQDKTFQTLHTMINENLSFLGKRGFQLYNAFPEILRWLPGEHNKIFQNASMLQTFLRGLIENHVLTRDANCPRDFVDCFLNKIEEEAKNPNPHHSIDSFTLTTFNLFIAGTGTTSSTIRWAIKFMLEYPEIQKKVQDEIDRVIGSEIWPSLEHRLSLPYTDAVLHEVQRFASVVPNGLPHAALHDIKFKGYTIPKDTTIITFLHSALYDKKYWDKPEEFNPDRFLDGNGKFVKNEAFIPFGAGKRVCIGESLAKTEIFIYMVSFLQRFNLKFPPGERGPIGLMPGGTRDPEPFNVCAEWRL
ncbi:cytochrome P450 2F2-like [Dendropsophus ebraccatus]|uniref:cytochrome P450 2F2-like n=1 Tax=Dendropsophus ebraccatus TaxID=150705 RepID=UPI003831371D